MALKIISYVTNMDEDAVDGFSRNTAKIIRVLQNNFRLTLVGLSVKGGGTRCNSRIYERTTISRSWRVIITEFCSLLAKPKSKRFDDASLLYFDGIAWAPIVFLSGQLPVIFNLVDSPRLRFKRLFFADMTVKKFLKMVLGFCLERLIVSRASAIVVVSPAERKSLIDRYPKMEKKIHQINVYAIDQQSRESRSSHNINRFVVLADFSVDYLASSTETFLRSIASSLQSVNVVLVGRNSEFLAMKYGCKSYNFVENLDEFLLSSKAVIVPDLVGSGIKTRVIHAAMLGVPVLATPCAMEGLDMLSDGISYVKIPHDCNSEWMLSLAQRPCNELSQIGRRGRDTVEKHFSWKSIDQAWLNLFGRVLNG